MTHCGFLNYEENRAWTFFNNLAEESKYWISNPQDKPRVKDNIELQN